MLTKNINYDTRAYNQVKGFTDTPVIIDYYRYVDYFNTLREYFNGPFYQNPFASEASNKKEELKRAKEYLSIYELHKVFKNSFRLYPTHLFNNIYSYNSLLRLLIEVSAETDPLNLKVEYGMNEGSVKEAEINFVNCHKLTTEKVDFLRNCPIIFESIKLNQNISEETGSRYASLICDTQVSSRKAVTNYSDKDVIKMFTELHYRKELLQSDVLVTKYIDENLLKIYKIMIDLSSHPVCDLETKVRAIESSMTIVSFMKALMLYKKYVTSSNNLEKKKIISEIQEIFDGRITLEKVLEYNDIKFNEDEAIRTIKSTKKVLTI